MLLTIPERYAVNSVLPEAGNFGTLKTMRKLREALEPTENESKEFGIRFETNPTTGQSQVRWDPEKMVDAEGKLREAEIDINKKATGIIVEALEKRDATKKLTAQQYSIYEKFVEQDGEQTEE